MLDKIFLGVVTALLMVSTLLVLIVFFELIISFFKKDDGENNASEEKNMKFEIEKLIHYGNRDKAIVGNKYYFFKDLNTFIKYFNKNTYGIGIFIGLKEEAIANPFKTKDVDQGFFDYYSFLYPVEDEEEKPFSLKTKIENAKKQA